jgi:hypothetical protein
MPRLGHTDAVDGQRELDAVVAHGLLNSLAVISGAADTILRYGAAMEPDDLAILTTAIDEQSAVFTDGLQVLIRHSSDAFADAATAVVLAAGTANHVDDPERTIALEALVRRTALIRQTLEALVRGLPPEVLSLLGDGLHPGD